MAINTNVSYNQTRDEIIYDALIALNAIAPGEVVEPDDSQIMITILNKMIKAWEAQGIHLWAETLGTLFLQKGQIKYELNVDGDHATNSYIATFINGNISSGATTITVDSTAGMAVNDYIGIYLSTGYRQWTTIASIINGTSLTIADALTSGVDDEATIYSYTTKIYRPLAIQQATRGYPATTSTDPYQFQEVPLTMRSRIDYLNLPNKLDQGYVNQWYYDKQRDTGYLHVWQAPALATDIINFSYSRPFADVLQASDNVDFPQEWLEPITHNLAWRGAPMYEKDQQQISVLKELAVTTKAEALAWDDEDGSVYITPDYRGVP